MLSFFTNVAPDVAPVELWLKSVDSWEISCTLYLTRKRVLAPRAASVWFTKVCTKCTQYSILLAWIRISTVASNMSINDIASRKPLLILN